MPDQPRSARATRALIDSWHLSLEAENKSPRTVGNYLESMTLFVRWLEDPDHPDRPLAPEQVTAAVLRTWLVELIETRSASTARTRWNGLRHFWAWCADEDEIPVNPMALVKQPAVEEKVVPMLTVEDLKLLLKSCEGPRLLDRRDVALIMTYADAGPRLSELALAQVDDLDLRTRELRVMGKGRRERVLPFGVATARALDRYLRVRNRQPTADQPWLWLSGKDGRQINPDGIKQMLSRRGQQAGLHVHAHKLRHGFAHEWLSHGGSEGDLMELMGWRSRQMVTRYASATRSQRARESYRDGRSPMDNL